MAGAAGVVAAGTGVVTGTGAGAGAGAEVLEVVAVEELDAAGVALG